MANWFSDTWREITSGGKARTETYNRRSEPTRRRTSTPAPKRASSTTTSTRTSGGGGGAGGGGGRVSASAARTPVRVPQRLSSERSDRGGTSERREPQQSSWRGVANPEQYGRRPEPDEPAPSAGARYSPTLQRDRDLAEETAVPTGTQRSAPGAGRTDVTTAKRLADVNSGAAAQRQQAATEQGAREQGARRYNPPVRTETRELTDEEFLALTPRQRAAVLYNTGLVNSARADREQGTGTQQTRDYLTSLDLAPEEELDAFLRLDRAIGDNVLARLDDPAARQQSAEARRWARGVPGAAPQSEEFSDARSAADRAASAMSAALSRGFTGIQTPGSSNVAEALAGGQAANRAGFGTSPRDVVIQQAFDAMIAADAQYTPEQVANGIANLNDINGTDVDPQEVWDFAKLRLDAADMAQLAGESFVLPVTDATIVPLSAADIRSRYGI